MKKIYAPILTAILVMAAFLVITPQVMAGNNNNGNDAPSGPHWNLNIIGVKKDKKGNLFTKVTFSLHNNTIGE